MILEVMLNSEKDAVDFVSKITAFPEHVDLSYGHYSVDAKSILGVLGIGVGKKVRLSVYSDDTRHWKKVLGDISHRDRRSIMRPLGGKDSSERFYA